jgi:hypothetical protein
MRKGLLMPFFGAGVNLSNRPEKQNFVPNGEFLPNASELSKELVREFDLERADPGEFPTDVPEGASWKWKEQSLLRIAWYISAVKGEAALYQHLQTVFGRDYAPSDVHKFFARFRKRLTEKGYEVKPQLIVTTNYDEVLERAFDAEGEPYDVFSYTIEPDSRFGKFSHTPYDGEAITINRPAKYAPKIDHTIILKIHGTAHPNWENCTFVITEDDYIDYAAFVQVDKIPVVLAARMKPRKFFYLGYSLSDWNFRVFLRGIKASSRFAKDPTWAIMDQLDNWDRVYWKKHEVQIIKTTLREHIDDLNKVIDDMPPIEPRG